MIYVVWHDIQFHETAIGIFDALYICNFEVELRRVDLDDKEFVHGVLYVVLGLHRFVSVPKKYIAVQAEQTGSKWITKSYVQKLKNALCVWDFSPKNCEYFRKMGVECRFVPIRVPLEIFVTGTLAINTHFSNRIKDIDVLFYGSQCPRREKVENDLRASGLKVVFRYNNLFNEEREDLISRAKVVLNIHYWLTSSLETHRIEYLCSRGKCVISEKSTDTFLDSQYQDSVIFSTYCSIVETSKHYVIHEDERNLVELRARVRCYQTQMQTKQIEDDIVFHSK